LFLSGFIGLILSGILAKEIRRKINSLRVDFENYENGRPLSAAVVGDDELDRLDAAFRKFIARNES